MTADPKDSVAIRFLRFDPSTTPAHLPLLAAGFLAIRAACLFILSPQPDEAALRLAADVFYSGRWLYADFAYDYPPMAPVLLGIVAKLFGLPLEALRVLCSLLLALTLVLTYGLARRFAGTQAALAALYLLVFEQGFEIYHGGADGRTLTTPLAVTAVWLFARRPDSRRDVILAVVVAFLAGFAHLAVLPLFILVFACALYRAETGRGRFVIAVGSLAAVAVLTFLLVRDWPAFRFQVLEDGRPLVDGWRHLQPLIVIALLFGLRKAAEARAPLRWAPTGLVVLWLAVSAYPHTLIRGWADGDALELARLKEVAAVIAEYSKARKHVLTSDGHLALLAKRELAPGLGKQARSLRTDWPEPQAIRFAAVTVGTLEHYLRQAIPEIVVISSDPDNPLQFLNVVSYGHRLMPLLERNYHVVASFPRHDGRHSAIIVHRKNEAVSEPAVRSELQ